MNFKKPKYNPRREEDLVKYTNDPLSYPSPSNIQANDKDLTEILTTINYSQLVKLYYIEIWVIIIIIISTFYYIRKKNSNHQSKDFNKTIVNRNNEKAKLVREKLELSYSNDLKTKPIPPSSDTHDHTKKFEKSTTSSKDNNSDFKSTEGMNPSTTRQRISFTSRDRSFVKYN